jgi:hypothetical protein
LTTIEVNVLATFPHYPAGSNATTNRRADSSSLTAANNGTDDCSYTGRCANLSDVVLR